ncbi:dual specificity protein kinase Ttk [Osmerus mordax]|uniref:dual specificity protein kinase Ttk n=1 Tax=Osmerus mordax TaxID=8014 RepID=UPI00350F2289
MEEEEHTDRKQQLAMLCQKLNKIKQHLNEDDTDNINKIIGSNSPETCLSYLVFLEKKGDPRLMDVYTRVFSNMPLAKHCQNESYARMLVRFAELKALQDVNEAEADFNVARSHCQDFAFVHIAHAQFERSQGNTKKSTFILQRAIELGAKPTESLHAALHNLQSGRAQQESSEDKENISAVAFKNAYDLGKKSSESRIASRNSDGMGDLPLSSAFCSGPDWRCGSLEHQASVWRSGSLRKGFVGMPGRVPIVPIPEMKDDEDGGSQERPVKRPDASFSSSLSRQASGSSVFTLSSVKTAVEGDFLNLKPPTTSPAPRPWEELAMVDSTTNLLRRKDTSRLEDTTYNLTQALSSNSPESCRCYLLSLERRGDPRTDPDLLARLRDCYSKVFSSLALGKHSRNESYARMLVRFAELKGIDDPDDARDNFTLARSISKSFAFVHIAHAQFEFAQGNGHKATSILLKAQSLATPAEHLETAMKNLRAGKSQLLPSDDTDRPPEPQSQGAMVSSSCAAEREQEAPFMVSQVQHKNPAREPGWKMPMRVTSLVSPEEKHTPPDPRLTPRLVDSLPTPSLPLPSRLHPPAVCQTPNYKDPAANSFYTPIVKRNHPVLAPSSTTHRAGPAQPPCTPLNQVSYTQQTPKGSFTPLSNESITIKGRQFFILKMIGRGGSSKVYQVLDHKKQLFAVKYVNLEEADAQTVESYKNEIEHLNHLQQYSDQIIKLYDYEITNSYIYMLMECGNLDLNTWLRNRKTVNSLERKFYWKNMLEAVHTIHKHGIIHSDLKPANFVIVNASLKLIDFGIANSIQPDVTSIMKDSQVGTLNYMPPEAIKDTSSKPGKASSKISTKGDVWSLGCILYCMTYGKTPFQSITNQITKLHAIIDPSHHIEFPDIAEKDLLDVLKRCLVRNPRERISISELLEHSYLQIQPSSEPAAPPDNNDLKKILNDLAALQSPSSIVRAASNLAKMCNSGRRLDVSDCVRSSSQPSWKM